MAGTLFVVATPIGNLEDISMRALRVLREAPLIAAEDTRRTAKLLSHYDIRRPMVSLREHNERRETPRLLARLASGESLALVSDAGTPTISDPGRVLVSAARQKGITVVPIPGPSAVMTALAGSGFPADRFLFLGFPPRAGTAREEWLDAVATEPGTVVCFEAPTRVEQTLADLTRRIGKRPIIVCRELSKIHEILVEYTMSTTIPARGEFTIVVGPQPTDTAPAVDRLDPALVTRLVHDLTVEAGFDRPQAETMVARAFLAKPTRIRNIVKKFTISIKQQNK
jgi:16S rRNA (cytidine1402-2'-O)-methyltransferase